MEEIGGIYVRNCQYGMLVNDAETKMSISLVYLSAHFVENLLLQTLAALVLWVILLV